MNQSYPVPSVDTAAPWYDYTDVGPPKTRTYWHSYADDTSPVDVTGIRDWRELAQLVPQLIGYQDTPGIGALWRAIRVGGPFHSPTFGCIFHRNCCS